MERILLDTDIGSDIDDAYALLFAVRSPALSLEGVTTVYGKTDVRAKIARKLLNYAGRDDVPVCAGSSVPLRSIHPIWETGVEGEGVLTADDRSHSLQEMDIRSDAVDFLIEKIMSEPGQYTLVTIGALTNVALALQREPRLAGNIKRMYMMAGGISYPSPLDIDHLVQSAGPIDNIAMDVQAAQIVFASSAPKTVVPIDVTSKASIEREAFSRFRTGHQADEAVSAMTRVWFGYRDAVFQELVSSTCMHDPLTVAAITNPHLLPSREVPFVVEANGQTRIRAGGNPVTLCYDVNSAAFERVFLETMARPLPYGAR